MGFSIVALAQKPRTQTLIVDSDLDMGQYDITATDVKGDTAEFSEFVGGVGNFESGLISGGLDVSGILHAESTLQVDGNIILEGSINNVNIDDNGEITTTQGVNGADFNGVIIKTDVYTVTPTDEVLITDLNAAGIVDTEYSPDILPFNVYGYSGSIKFTNNNTVRRNVSYQTDISSSSITVQPNTSGNITFTNIHYLRLGVDGALVRMNGFILS